MRAGAWAANRDIAAARLAGSARDGSQMHYLATTRIDSRCVSPAHPAVRQRVAALPRRHLGPLRGIARTVRTSRRQGVAGHRHGGDGDREYAPWPHRGGVTTGVRAHGSRRIIWRSHVDRGAVLCTLRRQDSGRRVARCSALVAHRDRIGRPSPYQRELLGGLSSGRRVGVPRSCPVAFGPCGWREAFDRAVSMTRTIDPGSHAVVIGYKYAALCRSTAGRRRRADRNRGGAAGRRAIQ